MLKPILAAGAASLLLAGCTGAEFQPIDAPYEEKPEMLGPLAMPIDTAYEKPMSCLADEIGPRRRSAVFAVGKVEDYTGQNIDTERPMVTQGAALMTIAALGKMDLRQVERYDTTVSELELKYAGQKLLGPGTPGRPATETEPAVPATSYTQVPAGVFRASDYTIIGGITELDFNTYSTAFDMRLGPLGRQDRLFAISVGVDLRLVNTKTLAVVDTVSLRKQVYGREYQNAAYFGIPFLGGTPFAGAQFDGSNRERVQEPIQRSVRLVIERAVMELVADLYHADPSGCLALAEVERVTSAKAETEPAQSG